jgi:chemotaxis signal transduction protein
VLAVEADQLRPMPESDPHPQRRYITAVTQKEEKLVLILDIDRALSGADKIVITQSQNPTAA